MNSSVVLVCAVLASLAAGVILAYAVCLMMFSMFRAHARQVSTQRLISLPVRVAGN